MSATTVQLKTLAELRPEIEAGESITMRDTALWDCGHIAPDPRIHIYKVMAGEAEGKYVCDFQGSERLYDTFSDLVADTPGGEAIWMALTAEDRKYWAVELDILANRPDIKAAERDQEKQRELFMQCQKDAQLVWEVLRRLVLSYPPDKQDECGRMICEEVLSFCKQRLEQIPS